MKHEPHKKGPEVIRVLPEDVPSTSAPSPAAAGHDFDVVLCGGVLGMFLATALQTRGFKVTCTPHPPTL